MSGAEQTTRAAPAQGRRVAATLALGLVGPGPPERSFTKRPSRSNQNGAPNEAPTAVSSQPASRDPSNVFQSNARWMNGTPSGHPMGNRVDRRRSRVVSMRGLDSDSCASFSASATDRAAQRDVVPEREPDRHDVDVERDGQDQADDQLPELGPALVPAGHAVHAGVEPRLERGLQALHAPGRLLP